MRFLVIFEFFAISLHPSQFQMFISGTGRVTHSKAGFSKSREGIVKILTSPQTADWS